jgi:hypothetical protein
MVLGNNGQLLTKSVHVIFKTATLVQFLNIADREITRHNFIK